MNVSILIASYARDYAWCEYNLKSIRKFAKGFHSVTLLVPSQDAALFLKLEQAYSTTELPVLIKHYVVMPGKEFNHHQAMKCYADVYCPQANFILHTDSDCIFTAPVTPGDYFVGDKPVLLKRSYADIIAKGGEHAGSVWWQAQTERALGEPCPYETMRRHPAVHPKGLYKPHREHIERIHLTSFTDYVLKQKNTALQGYSEFNSLGSFALRYFPDMHHWIDQQFEPSPIQKLHQNWSWIQGGVDAKRHEIERILAS